MNDLYNNINRPPIGFIVEGHGEYYCYPSLASRINHVKNLHIPIINAEGCGSIVANLEEHLRDLVSSKHPFSMIVTVDLRDVVRSKLYESCQHLKEDLENRIEKWIQTSQDKAKYQPLPQYFAVVVQVQKFESWLIADRNGLCRSGEVSVDAEEINSCNIDDEIQDPSEWLKLRMQSPNRLKDPTMVKQLVSNLDIEVAMQSSRSFRKFTKEVKKAYELYCSINQLPSDIN